MVQKNKVATSPTSTFSISNLSNTAGKTTDASEIKPTSEAMSDNLSSCFSLSLGKIKFTKDTLTTTICNCQFAKGEKYDWELQNATVANDWMIVRVATLTIPENLLAFLPLGLLLPRLIAKLRERMRKFKVPAFANQLRQGYDGQKATAGRQSAKFKIKV